MIGSGKPVTGRPRKFSERSGRSDVVTFRLSEDDKQKLELISKSYGITQTDFLIFCIRSEAEKIRRLDGKER